MEKGAYSYVHTTVFRLNNQQNISQQKWIISWNTYVCIFVLQDMRVMQYQTCIGIVKHMDTPNDHNRNIGRLPGSRKFPSTFAFFELHCCSEIPRYPNFSPRNLGLQVRNSRHCAGHSLVEDLCFRLLCLRECWQNVGVQIWEFQTHK